MDTTYLPATRETCILNVNNNVCNTFAFIECSGGPAGRGPGGQAQLPQLRETGGHCDQVRRLPALAARHAGARFENPTYRGVKLDW